MDAHSGAADRPTGHAGCCRQARIAAAPGGACLSVHRPRRSRLPVFPGRKPVGRTDATKVAMGVPGGGVSLDSRRSTPAEWCQTARSWRGNSDLQRRGWQAVQPSEAAACRRRIARVRSKFSRRQPCRASFASRAADADRDTPSSRAASFAPHQYPELTGVPSTPATCRHHRARLQFLIFRPESQDDESPAG